MTKLEEPRAAALDIATVSAPHTGRDAIRLCRGPITVYVAGTGTMADAARAVQVIHEAALYADLCPDIVVGLYAANGSWYLDFATCTFTPGTVAPETARRHQIEAPAKVRAALAASGFAFAMNPD